MPEDKPTIRHKKRLEKIREEANGRPEFASGRRHSSSGIEENGSAIGASSRADSDIESDTGRTSSRTEGTAPIEGTVRGFDSGAGSTITEISNHYSGTGEEGSIQSVTPERDMTVERERKRQLAAARQRRHRANEKQAQNEPKTSRDSDQSDVKIDLKAAFKKGSLDDVKVFTEKEASDQLEKLIFVYMRGSEILDDVLEIVVKGHEKVKIWALDEDEAKMIATMQMERAKKDKAAARTVRTLISIYDRMYLFMIVGPRVVATGQHIKAHGGLSFK